MDNQKLLFSYKANGDRMYYSIQDNHFYKTIITTEKKERYMLLWGEFLSELYDIYNYHKSAMRLYITNIELIKILNDKQMTETDYWFCRNCFRPFEIVNSRDKHDELGYYIWGRFRGLQINSRIYVNRYGYLCKKCQR